MINGHVTVYYYNDTRSTRRPCSIMINVTSRRFDQSAKQLIVSHTTRYLLTCTCRTMGWLSQASHYLCRNLSNLFLNWFTDVASTTSWDNLFRSCITRWLNENFRTSRLVRCFDSFMVWPLNWYSQVESWKNWLRSTISFPVIILKVSILGHLWFFAPSE